MQQEDKSTTQLFPKQQKIPENSGTDTAPLGQLLPPLQGDEILQCVIAWKLEILDQEARQAGRRTKKETPHDVLVNAMLKHSGKTFTVKSVPDKKVVKEMDKK